MLKAMYEEKLKKVKPENSKLDMGIEQSAKEIFPSFSLDSKTLPEIEGWEVGQDYCIVMKVTQTSMDSHTAEKKVFHSGRFEIKEIGVLNKSETKAEDVTGKDEKELLKKKFIK